LFVNVLPKVLFRLYSGCDPTSNRLPLVVFLLDTFLELSGISFVSAAMIFAIKFFTKHFHAKEAREPTAEPSLTDHLKDVDLADINDEEVTQRKHKWEIYKTDFSFVVVFAILFSVIFVFHSAKPHYIGKKMLSRENITFKIDNPYEIHMFDPILPLYLLRDSHRTSQLRIERMGILPSRVSISDGFLTNFTAADFTPLLLQAVVEKTSSKVPPPLVKTFLVSFLYTATYVFIRQIGTFSFGVHRHIVIASSLIIAFALYQILSLFARPFLNLYRHHAMYSSDCIVNSVYRPMRKSLETLYRYNLNEYESSPLYRILYQETPSLVDRLRNLDICSKGSMRRFRRT
jgi:hypothetical protein